MEYCYYSRLIFSNNYGLCENKRPNFERKQRQPYAGIQDQNNTDLDTVFLWIFLSNWLSDCINKNICLSPNSWEMLSSSSQTTV